MGDGTISVVMPTYNVATYLPAFLASIDAQRSSLAAIEFVFVDDGSPDDSAEIITAWTAQRPHLSTRLVRKQNGGLASARNAGLEVATGEWVTFPDPDDVLSEDYLGLLARFVGSPAADTVHVVAGAFVYYDEQRDVYSDTHPLRGRFHAGTRVVDLAAEPQCFHVAANTGLFRREVLERFGLRYDGSVAPVWEDGHLTARYLSKFERPRIALLADAVYYYRRRLDGTSLMDGQWTNPGKFVAVPRNGWLDALRSAAAEHEGHAPAWLQNMVLYDVMGYFREERRSPSPTANTPREVSDEFFSILSECMGFIDLDVLDDFRVNDVTLEIREVLRLHFKGADPRPRQVAVDRLDDGRGLVRLHWFYTGAAPVETFRADGLVVAPVYAKTRPCTFYGRDLCFERLVWLPSDATLALELDGVVTPLRTGPVEIPAPTLAPVDPRVGASADALVPSLHRPGLGSRLERAQRRLRSRVRGVARTYGRRRTRARATLRLARTHYYRHKYRDAWLLIDRDNQAQDNAEHLYRWLRAHRPQVNAWFVLAPSSPDWARLEAEGFRLIAHRSREHDIALLDAQHVISSQIDKYVTIPQSAALFGEQNVQQWRYTFLQHGVTKDDLSTWINPKPIELMITATPDEQSSIVSDTSPYVWGEREVRMTGFPRHDRLLQLARGPQGSDPDLILVMPTWRRSLVRDRLAGANDRALRDDFWQTEYATQWRRVLESEELHRKADEHGYRIVFVPHPNMQRYLDNSPLPDWVRSERFSQVDIQELLARSVMLVTDYSSMGFEMAYLERPVVYFQFDQQAFFSGSHAYRRGSWSYEDDGFGPVTVEASEAIRAIDDIVDRDGTPDPLYAKRMATTFPWRDGRCSERTYEAVVALTTPLSRAQRYRTLENPDVLHGRPVADELRG